MPKTLLLADDSVTIQKVVGITFANEDVELVSVDNGQDALQRAREIKPDLVLSDVSMPGMDGYELCAALKADPELAAIPVLLLTGTFEEFDEARAAEARVDGHIAKPFEAQVLVDRVFELMNRPASPEPAAPASPNEAAEPVLPRESFAPPPPAGDFSFGDLDFNDPGRTEPARSRPDEDRPSSPPQDQTRLVEAPPPGQDTLPVQEPEADPFALPTAPPEPPAAPAEGPAAAADASPFDPTYFNTRAFQDPLGEGREETGESPSKDETPLEEDPLRVEPPAHSELADDPFAGDLNAPETPLDDRPAGFDPRGRDDQATTQPERHTAIFAAPDPASTDSGTVPTAAVPDSDPKPPGELPPGLALGSSGSASASPAPAVVLDRDAVQQAIEKIAWEAFGSVSEQIVREVVGRVEAIAWDVVPKIAERLIREELERMKAHASD